MVVTDPRTPCLIGVGQHTWHRHETGDAGAPEPLLMWEAMARLGGMTLGADPIAVATAVAAAHTGRHLQAFSIRKEAKDHGTGGRLVGPVRAGSRVVVLEDTTTTGSALCEAIDALLEAEVTIVKAVALVDRSGDVARARVTAMGIPYVALVTPDDLGVGD
jgi:orotate phosphoribosyltransferase